MSDNSSIHVGSMVVCIRDDFTSALLSTIPTRAKS
jgi:hypothetical protein